MNTQVFSKFLRFFIVLSLFISACKKDNPGIDNGGNPDDGSNTKQTPTTDRMALTNDSIFLYAKQIYYWNEELPSYDVFEPRQYTSNSDKLRNYETNLLAIAQYSTARYDIITHEGVDYTKFSYIEDVSGTGGFTAGVRNLTNSVNLIGEGNDIGIYDIAAYGSDTDYKVFIKAVYPGSPAAENGLTRGATITKIDGETIGDNWDSDYSYISKLLEDPFTIRLEGRKANGTAYAVSLSKQRYNSSPIYKDTVLSANNKNIGYLAYARFSDEDNSFAALSDVFSKFAAQNVEDLIIDLRYNGGGYVTTAERMANLIAPNGTTETMFVEYYNQLMQDGKATILKNQPVRDANGNIVGTGTYADHSYKPEASGNTVNFKKEGNLGGVKNIVFLVTNNTASASELVINSLRGLNTVNIKLVGTTTYGKPVGFFPVRLEGIYDLYLPSFSSKNAKGEGDYYDGFRPGTDIPGKEMVDNLGQDLDAFSEYDFGDPRELYLAEALSQLGVTISTTSSGPLMNVRRRQSTQPSQNMLKNRRVNKEFKGMIETRVR
ncbi:S41 family peptidase [Olivibacter sp. XZL3]|uniref:S41 family peptidase n=1 Tax=Olivibacter sp. XZL3 TaxID=1735116 RepID=UPI001064A2BD|nr:S41 family peptidase [Olivibacter sp. XZL3]